MKKKYWILIFGVVFLNTGLKAQDDKFKALFMYNFTKYLEWPVDKQKGDFVIGIYGSSPILTELNIIAEKRKVGSQKIIIKKLTSLSEIGQCNIIYIPENRSVKIEEVNRQCLGKGIAIITDKPGLAHNHSGINYVKINGKQNFEINRTNLEQQGIKVNSALLSLGITIE